MTTFLPCQRCDPDGFENAAAPQYLTALVSAAGVALVDHPFAVGMEQAATREFTATRVANLCKRHAAKRKQSLRAVSNMMALAAANEREREREQDEKDG